MATDEVRSKAAVDAASVGEGWKPQMPNSPSMRAASPIQGTLSTCTSLRRQRTCEDNYVQMPGAWPQPKWPPNHVSEAFEAVAAKKSLILSPAEIYAEIAHHGEEKAKFHWTKVALLAIVAGMYCGFGFTLCLIVGGNMPKAWLTDSPGLFSLLFGAVGFPFSFTLILVCGAELYTSLCAYMTAAWWEGKVRARDCVRMWVSSWLWNFVGCAIFVGLMYASGTYKHKDWYIQVLAHKKVSKGWGEVLVQAIFANWLVCIATWQANAAQDLTGKAVAVWLPISAFAMLGFEHCIANQFLIPMAIALGAPVSAREFVWHNLIPATIGNWIGGAICMATVYAFIYGKPPKQLFAWLEERKLQRQQNRQLRAKQQEKKPQVEVRVPVTLDADAEVSFATHKTFKNAGEGWEGAEVLEQAEGMGENAGEEPADGQAAAAATAEEDAGGEVAAALRSAAWLRLAQQINTAAEAAAAKGQLEDSFAQYQDLFMQYGEYLLNVLPHDALERAGLLAEEPAAAAAASEVPVKQQEKKPQVEVRVPVTLGADAEVSFATHKTFK